MNNCRKSDNEHLSENTRFVDGLGRESKGNDVVFPICKWIDFKKQCWKPIGTAFLISRDGLFITAKHVLEESNRYEGKEQNLFCIQFMPNYEFYKVPIKADIHTHSISDIGFGQLYTLRHNKTGDIYLSSKVLVLSSRIPNIGETVLTWAYPGKGYYEDKLRINITPELAVGRVLDNSSPSKYPSILKSPYIVTTMETYGGVSGGPVFSAEKKGKVIGINSSGLAGSYSCFTPIAPLLEIPFELEYNGRTKKTTLREMSEEGWIKIED